MTCAGETAIPVPPPASVLFVLDYFYPHLGGGETLFWELSRAAAKAGSRVSVVTPRLRGMKAREVVDGVEIVRVWTPRFAPHVWFMLLAIPIAWRLAKRVSLIHAAVYFAAVPACLAATLRGKPLVITVHEVFGDQWQQLKAIGRLTGWAARVFERIVVGLPAARYICVSDFTKRRLMRFARIPETKISVVYNAVDYGFWKRDRHCARPLRKEHGWPDTTFVYLFFGRPGVSKGVDTLVAAAAEVRQRLPESRLVLLLGREPAAGRRSIESTVRRHALGNHVLVLDSVPRDELPGYLLAADCVVVPSVSEGFGYSAVEARAIGCRVLATAGHAVEEVLWGEVELCPSGDSKAMADRIVEIARVPCNVPPHTPKYDLATHLQNTLQVYQLVSSATSALGPIRR